MSRLNAQQIASLLQQEGVAKKDIPTLTAISLAESGGSPQAFNPRGFDKSYGLFQVNMYGDLGPARMKQFGLKSEKELFDPPTNVKAAKQIFESQGLGAWSVYKGGQYKQFLPEAQKATAALGAQQPEPQPAADDSTAFYKDLIAKIPQVDTGKLFLRNYYFNKLAQGQLPQAPSLINPAGIFRAAVDLSGVNKIPSLMEDS